MIFRILGSIFIVASTSAFGYLKAEKLKKREQQLDNFIRAFRQFQNEIKFTQTPVAKAFRKISESLCQEVSKIFCDFSTGMQNAGGDTAAALWLQSLDKNKEFLSLNDDDINIIKTLGDSLGNTDIYGQENALEALILSIEHRRRDACEKREKNHKLYTSLGIYSGILICILLF